MFDLLPDSLFRAMMTNRWKNRQTEWEVPDMADKATTTRSGVAKKTSSTSSRTSSGRSASSSGRGRKRRSSKKQSGPSLFTSLLVALYTVISATYFGRLLVTILLTGVIIGLDLLISGDKMQPFYLMVGIELIILTAGSWFYYLWRREQADG